MIDTIFAQVFWMELMWDIYKGARTCLPLNSRAEVNAPQPDMHAPPQTSLGYLLLSSAERLKHRPAGLTELERRGVVDMTRHNCGGVAKVASKKEEGRSCHQDSPYFTFLLGGELWQPSRARERHGLI